MQLFLISDFKSISEQTDFHEVWLSILEIKIIIILKRKIMGFFEILKKKKKEKSLIKDSKDINPFFFSQNKNKKFKMY